MNKIITSYDYPPIPLRQYDWSAFRESYDEGDLIGYGETEASAINDLKIQEAENLDTEPIADLMDEAINKLEKLIK